MRVIGGKYRRRVLQSAESRKTRPMLDRMRETLFDILQFEIEGVVFADLFAGTGAVGIEALSRGAKKAIFVEQNGSAAGAISANLQLLGAEAEALVVRSPVLEALPRLDADVWFVGAPYPDHEAYLATMVALVEKNPRLVVVQHDRRLKLPDQFDELTCYRTRRMGSNVLSFYRMEPTDEAAASS